MGSPSSRPTHLITLADGRQYLQEEPPLHCTLNTTALIDGQMLPIGLALAVLLAHRMALETKVKLLETEVADLRETLHSHRIERTDAEVEGEDQG